MYALFEEMDADGSEVIDKRELQMLLESLDVQLPQKEIIMLFRKYDTDGSGEIDFDEFLALIKDLVMRAKALMLSSDEATTSPEMQQTEKIEQLVRSGTVKSLRSLHQNEASAAPDGTSPDEAPSDGAVDASAPALAKRLQSMRQLDQAEQQACMKRTLFCIPVAPEGLARRAMAWCGKVADSRGFDRAILFCIVVSSVTLAIENPGIGDNSPTRAALDVIDIIMNSMFFLECFLKIFSQSFRVYISSGWNRLDFLIVVTSAIDIAIMIFAPTIKLDIFRIFKILRALRPLRFVARVKKLRILASTIASAARPVANTVVLALGVFLIFGVLFMQLLAGKMNACTDPLVIHFLDCNDIADGVKREWVPYPVNFDYILPAVQSIYVLATQDDWPNHMLAGIDATDARTGPYQNNAPLLVIFYVATILLAGYLVVNIFVGVFVDCYQSAQLEMEEKGKTPKVVGSKLPQIFDDPDSRTVLGHIFDVVTTTQFDIFVAFFIVTNVISMAFESFKQSDFQNEFAEVTNYFFSFIFGWECIAKIHAFRPRRYFLDGWNKFDFFIVLISFGGILVENLGSAVALDPTVLRILRVFRIFRILRAFRIFKAAKGLQQIVSTLSGSLSSLASLLMMLLLMFFIFSILGVSLFANLCAAGDEGAPGMRGVKCFVAPGELMMEPTAHFKGIHWALLTLFRVATGDAWGALMDSSGLQVPCLPRKAILCSCSDPIRVRLATIFEIISLSATRFFISRVNERGHSPCTLCFSAWGARDRGGHRWQVVDLCGAPWSRSLAASAWDGRLHRPHQPLRTFSSCKGAPQKFVLCSVLPSEPETPSLNKLAISTSLDSVPPARDLYTLGLALFRLQSESGTRASSAWRRTPTGPHLPRLPTRKRGLGCWRRRYQTASPGRRWMRSRQRGWWTAAWGDTTARRDTRGSVSRRAGRTFRSSTTAASSPSRPSCCCSSSSPCSWNSSTRLAASPASFDPGSADTDAQQNCLQSACERLACCCAPATSDQHDPIAPMQAEDLDEQAGEIMPGTTNLQRSVFLRIHRRWELNARRRIKMKRRKLALQYSRSVGDVGERVGAMSPPAGRDAMPG